MRKIKFIAVCLMFVVTHNIYAEVSNEEHQEASELTTQPIDKH